MKVDVAVIGGGPAGCSAAISLADLGLTATIVDGGICRRRPSETAPPELAQRLSRLRAADALSCCRPCFGISSLWGGHARFQSGIVNPAGHAWFVDRSRFDRALREISLNRGISFMAAEAAAVRFFADRVEIFGPETSIEARWAIIATGSHALASRSTGQAPVVVDQLICYWMSLETASPEQILTIEPADYGWWYVCPEEEGRISVCLVTDAQAAREMGVSSPLKWSDLLRATHLHSVLRPDGPRDFLRAGDAGLSVVPKKTAHRWTVIGDAALKLDPLGSSGIMLALESGHLAAKDLAPFLQVGKVRDDSFDAWYCRLFDRFVCERERQYLIEQSRRNFPFWSRRTPLFGQRLRGVAESKDATDAPESANEVHPIALSRNV